MEIQRSLFALDQGPQTHFLGLDQPTLVAAGDFLLQKYRRGSVLRMDQLTVVTPTARAGRRLKQRLAETCDAQALAFLPPRLVTTSEVPELFYAPKRGFASTATQQLAWTYALKHAGRSVRRCLIPGTEEGDDWSALRWLDAGRIFWRLYRQLAAEGLSFSDIAEWGAAQDQFPDAARWQSLAVLQTHYLRQLDAAQLWDRQTARLVAVRHQECRFDDDLILLATPDINRNLQRMLQQIADTADILALVQAPLSWRERFDAFGVLRPGSWQDVEITLTDDQWSVRNRPEDQAEEVAHQLAQIAPATHVGDLTLCCADQKLTPYILRQLATREVAARSVAGRSIQQTAPYLLLQAIANWIRGYGREEFAELARHPDLLAWLNERRVASGWLAELDEYHRTYLAGVYDGHWKGKPSDFANLRLAFDAICELLEPLTGENRPLHEWSRAIQTVASKAYENRNLDVQQDQETISAMTQIAEVLQEVAQVAPDVSVSISAGEAIHMALSFVSAANIVPPSDPTAVDILGWLELGLDDATNVIVAGVHEATIPNATTSDQFLPNQLREQLGIDDADRRYARDAYIFCTLLNSYRNVHVVAGRLSEEGDPLRPCRLLLATHGDQLIHRWERFLAPTRSQRNGATQGPSGEAPSEFDVPRPSPEARHSLHRLSPSAFAKYLECPYRFYLRNVVGLREKAGDYERELGAHQIGTILHDMLRQFADSDVADGENVDVTEQFLLNQLAEARNRFGKAALAMVKIQFEQFHNVIREFAKRQAKLFHEGWRIQHTEVNLEFPFIVDDEPISIYGCIDRIDRNVHSGNWRILDYKTAERALAPEKVHQKDGGWINLQLPLYRHIAQALGIEAAELAYFSVPIGGSVTVKVAPWSEADIDDAMDAARQVVRNIRERRFWPPSDQLQFRDQWEDICMTGVVDVPKYKSEWHS